ncbi:hypothetical protein LIER_37057 [Lithospermum erythrorhizon]|uniref:Uncharacterized protein n=1 Tax=Lithospermum erythrorhizon TaxID=34254 RepID=A0AAV3PEH1_LITER
MKIDSRIIYHVPKFRDKSSGPCNPLKSSAAEKEVIEQENSIWTFGDDDHLSEKEMDNKRMDSENLLKIWMGILIFGGLHQNQKEYKKERTHEIDQRVLTKECFSPSESSDSIPSKWPKKVEIIRRTSKEIIDGAHPEESLGAVFKHNLARAKFALSVLHKSIVDDEYGRGIEKFCTTPSASKVISSRKKNKHSTNKGYYQNSFGQWRKSSKRTFPPGMRLDTITNQTNLN